MGGQLVVECARTTALDGLRGRTQMVLVLMAAHALDRAKGDTPARVYWLGHRTLALEVFGDLEYGQNSYGRKATKAAIRELLKRGLIRVYAQRPGGTTAYEILPRGGDPNSPHRGGPQ